MSLAIAPIADDRGAFRTFAGLFLRISADDDRTLRVRTPSQLRILLDLDVPEELAVFVIGWYVDQLFD